MLDPIPPPPNYLTHLCVKTACEEMLRKKITTVRYFRTSGASVRHGESKVCCIHSVYKTRYEALTVVLAVMFV